MSEFNDFDISSNVNSAVIKGYSSDIRPGPSRLYSVEALPAFYYDIEAQRRFNQRKARNRPTSPESVPDYVPQSMPPQQESQSDESSTLE